MFCYNFILNNFNPIEVVGRNSQALFELGNLKTLITK